MAIRILVGLLGLTYLRAEEGVPAQLDFRFRDTVGASNQAHSFVRFTILPEAAGRQWFVDIIGSRTGQSLAGRFAAGPEIGRPKGVQIFLAPSFSLNGKSKLFGEGFQVYWKRPKSRRMPQVALAAPVLELYQELGKGVVSQGFKHNHQLVVFVRPRVAVGEELFMVLPFGRALKTAEKKPGGYYGPIFGIFADKGKKVMLEASYLRGFQRERMVRLRVIYNFSLAFGR